MVITRKRKLALTGTILTLTLGVCTSALAKEQDKPTAAGLNSFGAISFKQGEDSVILDSADLYKLADKIDSFKEAVVNQLADLHTYLTASGTGVPLETEDNVNVVHSKPSDTVDPLSVDFDTILKEMAASQSIPLSVSEYGYAKGTKLYRTNDGKLTEDSSGQGTKELQIASATAGHLSAGRAAWVDGTLLLGTGADNQIYYQAGYQTGHTTGYNKGHDAGYQEGNRKNVQSITGSGVLNFKPNNGWTADRSYTLKKGYLYLTLVTSTQSSRWCFAKGYAAINGSPISFTTGFYNYGPEDDDSSKNGPTGQYQYSGFIPVNEGDVLTMHFENQITNVTLCSYHYNGINVY